VYLGMMSRSGENAPSETLDLRMRAGLGKWRSGVVGGAEHRHMTSSITRLR
jgi:hypothetical protein